MGSQAARGEKYLYSLIDYYYLFDIVIYANFMRNVSALNYVVGAWWFQFVDQPIGGRGSDGENGNNGAVSSLDKGIIMAIFVCFCYVSFIEIIKEYTPLVDAMTSTNLLVDGIHGKTRTWPAKCSRMLLIRLISSTLINLI